MASSNVSFTGYLPRQEYVRTVARAQAMVFAGCEDFGIALAEAQACGTPLIVFGRGGARDIVQPFGEAEHPTGILFGSQSKESLKEAIHVFEQNQPAIKSQACRSNADRFSEDRFDLAILKALAVAQAAHVRR